MPKDPFPRTCVHPSGRFVYGIHRPSYKVKNYRLSSVNLVLGHTRDGAPVRNDANFPSGDLEIENAQQIYEVPNPFPFWGCTYILRDSADRFAKDPVGYRFKHHAPVEQGDMDLVAELASGRIRREDGTPCSLSDLPRTVRLALAQTSGDPRVLAALASMACELEYDGQGMPAGIRYDEDGRGGVRPLVHDHDLFEVLGNNPALPYEYKLAMVLNPGVQGTSPVVGEYSSGPDTHVWEYLRANSYIPWGHFASNMAQDSVRYKAKDLGLEDIKGLRHLYYQRVFLQMALGLGLESWVEERDTPLSPGDMEELRLRLQEKIQEYRHRGRELPFNCTLWGWNYGYDFSPTGYRLHASHQQIHQQFALVTPHAETGQGEAIPTYAIGDQVAWFIREYEKVHGVPFFDAYIRALDSNHRMDGRRDRPRELVIKEDRGVAIVVPKAQRSQGEVHIMLKEAAGNLMEVDSKARDALDYFIFLVIRAFHHLGAEMVTAFEVSKRFDSEDQDQRLLYCFLPRHPHSPGSFSERQGRWITGHYPEDFAAAFRAAMEAGRASRSDRV